MADRRQRRQRQPTDGTPPTPTNNLLTNAAANAYPEGNWLATLMKMGSGGSGGGAGMTSNAFGPTGYSDWLRNDSFGMADTLYKMAVQTNPRLTRDEFNTQLASDPRFAQAFGPEAYKPFNAQENPRDYYNMQLEDSGLNMAGVSPYERYMKEEGYNLAADTYGAANQRDPTVTWFNYLTPGAFGR